MNFDIVTRNFISFIYFLCVCEFEMFFPSLRTLLKKKLKCKLTWNVNVHILNVGKTHVLGKTNPKSTCHCIDFSNNKMSTETFCGSVPRVNYYQYICSHVQWRISFIITQNVMRCLFNDWFLNCESLIGKYALFRYWAKHVFWHYMT